MNKKMKSAAILTLAAGMLGTAAVASPQNWTEVKALFNHKMQVTINGQAPETALTPLMVDGTAYLPVRELGQALNYDITWNEGDYRIDILKGSEETDGEEAEEEGVFDSTEAVILRVDQAESGGQTVDIAPIGTDNPYAIIRLHVSQEILAKSGELKPGMRVEAAYSKAMTRSIPPQTTAQSIEIVHELGEVEGTVQSVKKAGDHWMVWVTETPDEPGSGIVLNIGEESSVSTPSGAPADIEQIVKGTQLKAYYGPAVTLSLPPQSFAHAVILLNAEAE